MATRDVTVRLPRIDEIVPAATRQAILRHVALLAIGRIKRRTKAGQDVNGSPFAPYSVRYREQRRRAGWGTKPDLWLRGGMLNSLSLLEVDETRALIGFQGSSPRVVFRARSGRARHRRTGERLSLSPVETNLQVANALKAYWNQRGRKPRRFFALSSADRVFLARTALQLLIRAVGQQNLQRAFGRTK